MNRRSIIGMLGAAPIGLLGFKNKVFARGTPSYQFVIVTIYGESIPMETKFLGKGFYERNPTKECLKFQGYYQNSTPDLVTIASIRLLRNGEILQDKVSYDSYSFNLAHRDSLKLDYEIGFATGSITAQKGFIHDLESL